MPFEAGDIIRVPFPFTDRAMHKRRPALVLSVQDFNDQHMHLILAMVTSAKNPPWPSDVRIVDQAQAGLPSASVVRMKLFTLDARLALSVLGKLSVLDKKSVLQRTATTLGILA